MTSADVNSDVIHSVTHIVTMSCHMTRDENTVTAYAGRIPLRVNALLVLACKRYRTRQASPRCVECRGNMAAATGDDLDARMTAAYASGDMDAIMALLGISDACPAHATESPSVDDSGPARLDAHAEEFVPGGGGSATEEFAMSGDPGMGGVEGLIARFPRTQPELVEAVLDSCGGDVAEATRMLGEMEQEAEFYEQVDTHAYVEAVKHFDEQFPSLGGPGGGQSVQLGSDKQQTPYDSSLLLKMRKDTLLAQFPWVDPSVVDVELTAAAGSSHAAGQRLEALYPKPEGWDALEKKKVEDMRLARQRAARANAGIGENVAPARSSDAVRKTRDMGGHWVATGESVRLLYESLRAEAADEASVRNTYFDGAAAAIRRGDGLAAKRLGALGREVCTDYFFAIADSLHSLAHWSVMVSL